MATANNGAYLNDLWKVGAVHALYIHDGHWYHHLKRFPGALFDRNGYVVFKTEQEFLISPHLNIKKQVSIPKPGISAIPGYVRVVPSSKISSPFDAPALDVDIHATAPSWLEGRQRLVQHLERERNQTLVRKKKKHASSLRCEACAFSFSAAYGECAAEYCELHHLVPFAQIELAAQTRLQDLAILCANCHRVVHLRNPPHTLEEVRNMLTRKQPVAQPPPSRGRAKPAK
jgi:5-methylcytosine-specific restriction protein A